MTDKPKVHTVDTDCCQVCLEIKNHHYPHNDHCTMLELREQKVLTHPKPLGPDEDFPKVTVG